MDILAQVISQVKLMRDHADALLELLDAAGALPPEEGRAQARVPAKGNRCPHCNVSNPARETVGGFGSDEEKIICGTCAKEL